MKFPLQVTAAATVLAALAACGGNTPNPPTPVQMGKLLEPVAGLQFETSSGVKGTTDAQGGFSYRSGDVVSFSVGKLTVGKGAAAPLMTMDQLVANAQNAADPQALNLIQILQTLDEDNNPANGIQISNTTVTKLSDLSAPLQAAALSDADAQTMVWTRCLALRCERLHPRAPR